MEDVEKLLKTALGEVERMLNSKTVVGEPIKIEGNTLIPLLSVGFGFGAGGGSGKCTESVKGEGRGSGTGGGGGVKPVAVLIINKEGVRLEPIKGGAASVLEKVAETVGKTVRKERGKSGDK
ncbi:MAG: sporulation protein YtfJ [Proteobacteria bacterium]|nr:sporulation protein YtfJ [Pseudomonadota bacterium]